MKIAIVYNHDSKEVINLFGIPNREKIGLKTIRRIEDALKSGGHQVKTFEGDKNFIDRLEEFMPRVIKGERPGLVFNVSYGIQGQSRYAHIPSILEMVGIPYVGSGPLAHALALDKVMAKTVFSQHKLPTPKYFVLNSWDDYKGNLSFPMVVKPKHEAVSFGVKLVKNERELEKAYHDITDTYKQSVLVEHYVEGREINIGLIGNGKPDTFPPVELVFGRKGPRIYRYEDKNRTSGREISYRIVDGLNRKVIEKAQELARNAFTALGCYDYARVDMRLDRKNNIYLLEVNSLPSLGSHSSYLVGAEFQGLNFISFINRLISVTSARYFGTPKPPAFNIKKTDRESLVVSFLSERRDRIESRLQEWTGIHSRTSDPVGIQTAVTKLTKSLESIGLTKIKEFTDEHLVWAWKTRADFDKGTFLIGHIDVPVDSSVQVQEFRRDPEWLYGEGIGLSRAPLVMMEFALRTLKYLRLLHKIPISILYYADEGRESHFSEEIIRAAASKAKNVLVLRAGNLRNKVVIQRRGRRKYRLFINEAPARLGKSRRKPNPLSWMFTKLSDIEKLSSSKERIAVATADVKTTAYPMLLPHRIAADVLVSYGQQKQANEIEREIKSILGKNGVNWELKLVSDRFPMKNKRANIRLARDLAQIATRWEIPFAQESSLWPSVAGTVPVSSGVVCGIGPVAKNLYTPQEAVLRISLLQRTLLLTQYLAQGMLGHKTD